MISSSPSLRFDSSIVWIVYHLIIVGFDDSKTIVFLTSCIVPSLNPSDVPSVVPSDVPSNRKFSSDLFCYTKGRLYINEWMISSLPSLRFDSSLVWIIYHLIIIGFDDSKIIVFLTYCVVPSLNPSDVPSVVQSDVPSNGTFCSVLFCCTNERIY